MAAQEGTMPSDRDRLARVFREQGIKNGWSQNVPYGELPESRQERWLALADVAIREIAQARAEGFRDGIERAAAFMDERFPRDPLNATTRPNATAMIRGLEGLPPLLFGDAIRALAPVQPPAVDLPDSTSAKATDPRGSGLRGGEDATGAVVRTHHLKCWPEPFAAIARGSKCHEVRKNDRDYQEGERVALNEYDPTTGAYSGRRLGARIGHVSTGWGMPPDLCAFSLLDVANLDFAPPLGSTPPAGATLSPTKPERSGGEGK